MQVVFVHQSVVVNTGLLAADLLAQNFRRHLTAIAVRGQLEETTATAGRLAIRCDHVVRPFSGQRRRVATRAQLTDVIVDVPLVAVGYDGQRFRSSQFGRRRADLRLLHGGGRRRCCNCQRMHRRTVVGRQRLAGFGVRWCREHIRQ